MHRRRPRQHPEFVAVPTPGAIEALARRLCMRPALDVPMMFYAQPRTVLSAEVYISGLPCVSQRFQRNPVNKLTTEYCDYSSGLGSGRGSGGMCLIMLVSGCCRLNVLDAWIHGQGGGEVREPPWGHRS